MYVCVDVEASGPVPPLFNLLSIGATVVRRAGERHELGASFYCELKPIFPGFDPDAIAVCGLDPDKLRREGDDPREALVRFADWIAAEQGGAPGTPIFVGHNAVFDWSYMAYYYAHFGLDNPFGYKGIDTKSLAMGRLQIPWSRTSKEQLEKQLELPAQDTEQIHNAGYDAWYQALLLQALLDR